MSNSNRLAALTQLKLALDARINERLAHYEETLTSGQPVSAETILEIVQFLAAVLSNTDTPAKEELEPRHWKRGAVDRMDANPNTRIEFNDNA